MLKKQSLIITLFLLLFCFNTYTFAQDDSLPVYFNGITLDAAQNLTLEQPSSVKQRKALEALPAQTVVRVVFDPDTEPSEYQDALNYLRGLKLPSGKRKIFIMGEILDSESLPRYRWDCDKKDGCTKDENEESKFHDYKTRINNYLTILNKEVDIWEIGNEVNGEWADEGCIKNAEESCYSDVKEETDENGKKVKSKPKPDITAKKIEYAIKEAKKRNKSIALTLIDQPQCTTWDKNTMIFWAREYLKPKIDKYKIDYLLISYYEDNCEDGTTSKVSSEDKDLTESEKEQIRKLPEDKLDAFLRTIYWNRTFNQLSGIFKNVGYIGFDEVGYSSEMKTCEKDELSYCKKDSKPASKIDLLNRYYGMQVKHPKYIGGHFWWTAQEDITYTGFYSSLIRHFR